MASKRREFLKNSSLGLLGSTYLSKMLSDSKNHSKSDKDLIECDKTTLDFYGAGPFYTEQPPEIVNNLLATANEPGDRILISGRVFNLNCSEFIPNTIIDVWHADHEGAYDNNGYNLRGFTRTNEQGFYMFETIMPGKYLNGSEYRPAHIHFKIKPPSFPLLTTQLYFEGDDKIAVDRSASISSGDFDASNRIISLEKNANGILEGQFDIVVDGEGIAVGTQDLHIDKGMIYSALPNPFEDSLEIKYGVFKESNVGIYVFNSEGKEVAKLEDKLMSPDKYSVFWNPGEDLANGYYFISIQVNNLQVHYLKILKR